MSKVIRISEPTYQRLEKHVSGFGDTPDSIVRKLLDYYESNGNGRQEKSPDSEEDVLVLDPSNPKDLTHTKVREGYFGEEQVSNWAELLRTAHRIGYEELESFEALFQVTLSNISKGKATDNSFKPVPGLPLFVQGANANKSWKDAFELARQLKIPMEMKFRWRQKKGASHPGKRGVLRWKPEA